MSKTQRQKLNELMNGVAQLAKEFQPGSAEYDELATAVACIGRARRIALERQPAEEQPS